MIVFENSLYPVFDQAGNVRRIAVYVRDITVRKRLEEAVHQAEEKYQNYLRKFHGGDFPDRP